MRHLSTGSKVRYAKAAYDGVFSLPPSQSALASSRSHKYIASPTTTAFPEFVQNPFHDVSTEGQAAIDHLWATLDEAHQEAAHETIAVPRELEPQSSRQKEHTGPLLSPNDWRLRSSSRSIWGSARERGLGIGKIGADLGWGLKRGPATERVCIGEKHYDEIVTFRGRYKRLIDLSEKAEEEALRARTSAKEGGKMIFQAEWVESICHGKNVLQLSVGEEAWGGRKGMRWRAGDFVFVERVGVVEHPRSGNILECSGDGRTVTVMFSRRFDLDGADVLLSRGYDTTCFRRQREALDSLEFDVLRQRLLNEQFAAEFREPHLNTRSPYIDNRLRQVSLRGTELRDLLLYYPVDSSPIPEEETYSDMLRSNQLLNSWIMRYSRPGPPLCIEGDPDLGLNESQTRAIAVSLSRRLSLIQGPPGTGKTLTIVRAIKLLKIHFQVPFPILVCAPTHVAVDHLLQSCVDEGLKVLRTGRTTKIVEQSQPHSADARRMEHRHFEEVESLKKKGELELRQLEKLRKERLLAEADGIVTGGKSEAERLMEHALYRSSQRIYQLQQTMHAEILSSVDVVCCTTWGTSALELQTVDFPLVFIDEAAMCTEPMTMVPLMKGSRQAILIGDHMQLPAIITSREAKKDDLHISMFERLEKAPHIPTSLLDIQYRMLPAISAYPNLTSYSSQIRDDHSLLSASPPASSYIPDSSHPAIFINHQYPEQRETWSFVNEKEADIVVHILGDLLLLNPELKGNDMGVIAPYAAQTTLITEKLRDSFGLQMLFRGGIPLERLKALSEVEVNTVDGFQGREKGIIVLSTVRSNRHGHVGFLEDKQRLNVSITRARRALFVLGNRPTLKARQVSKQWSYYRDFGDVLTWRGSQVWDEYIKWMEKRGMVFDWKTR